MKHQLVIDVLGIFGGLLLYGARAAVGKWLFTQILRLLRWVFVRGEHEVKLYHQFVAEEHAKKHHSK